MLGPVTGRPPPLSEPPPPAAGTVVTGTAGLEETLADGLTLAVLLTEALGETLTLALADTLALAEALADVDTEADGDGELDVFDGSGFGLHVRSCTLPWNLIELTTVVTVPGGFFV
jgi:hypothetical protein